MKKAKSSKNPASNYGEFATIKSQAGLNRYTSEVDALTSRVEEHLKKMGAIWM